MPSPTESASDSIGGGGGVKHYRKVGEEVVEKLCFPGANAGPWKKKLVCTITKQIERIRLGLGRIIASDRHLWVRKRLRERIDHCKAIQLAGVEHPVNQPKTLQHYQCPLNTSENPLINTRGICDVSFWTPVRPMRRSILVQNKTS